MTPQTLSLLAGLLTGSLNVLLALTVWTLLRGPHHAASVRLWLAGSCAAGIGVALGAARALVAEPWLPDLGSMLLLLSLLLRIAALRRHAGLPLRVDLAAGWFVSAAALVGIARLVDNPRLEACLLSGLMALTTAAFSAQAWQAGRRHGSRSARLLAWIEAAVALMLLLRVLSLAVGLNQQRTGLSWDGLLTLAASLVAAVYGNLAYLGLVLDDTRLAGAQAREAHLAAQLQREAAESRQSQLRVLMAERERLGDERSQLLNLLAHEIRQPLHNASGALQATGQLLQGLSADTGAGLLRATQRLDRAQAVLGDVRAVLDNTLAAATLLTRHSPLMRQDVELAFLVDLVLGDFSADERARISVQWLTRLGSAEFEPGLLRLALRNLLRNALQHGGPAVAVTLCIDEYEQPLSLALAVIDDGPGMPPNALLARRGLGLLVARRVAALHGGELVLTSRTPGGVNATLVLPLVADEAPLPAAA